jgi:predicted aspartyl protease
MSSAAAEGVPMGRVHVQFKIANNFDVMKVAEGEIPPERMRQVGMEGVIDTGATVLVLPESVVQFLGLRVARQTGVQYADGSKGVRNLVGNVYLELCGRGSVFDAVVEPNRDNALVGAIVLEVLDLLVDCNRKVVYPRDPQMPIALVE